MIRQTENGSILKLLVRAGTSREQVVGRHGDALKIAVRTKPEKGRANKKVLKLLSQALNIPAGRLSLVHGETSPEKEVEIEGLDPNVLNARLNDYLGG